MSDQDGAPEGRDDARRTARASPPGSPTSGPRCAATSTEPEPIEIAAGTSNFSRAEVPYGVDLAAAWSWRLLVIAGAAALLGYLISFLAVMVIPVVVALLISALVVPVVDWLVRHRRTPQRRRDPGRHRHHRLGRRRCSPSPGSRWPTGPATSPTRPWPASRRSRTGCATGRCNASDSQINDYIKSIQDAITEQSGEGGIVSRRHRGRHRGRPRARRLLHRAVLDLLLPGRRQPDLGLAGPALARGPRASGSTARAGSPGSR